MKICVAGWYFHEPLMKTLDDSKYDVFIVGHKAHKEADVVIPNVGLEFGCYDYYLENVWKDGDVLFMHDDLEVTEKALDAIANIGRDQVFLFSSEEEAQANGGAHGRAIFCSEKFLTKLKADGGIWWDEGNTGKVPELSATVPDYHNAGIKTFRAYLSTVPKDFSVNRRATIAGLKTGYRGRV